MKVHCDNQSVVAMVNNSTSSCASCMELIRILVSTSMRFNCRIFGKYIKSADNTLADSLSRLDFKRFWAHAPIHTKKHPENLPSNLWPIPTKWFKH